MRRSSRATTRSRPASPRASTCWSRRCARSASTSSSTASSIPTRNPPPSPPNNNDPPTPSPCAEGSGAKNERPDEFREPDRQAGNLRRDPHRNRVARQDPQLVVRRDQEARDDQLPH